MRPRKFTFGAYPLWFVASFVKSELIALEEHDWREGGVIKADFNLTLEQTLIRHATQRMGVDRSQVEQFILSCKGQSK